MVALFLATTLMASCGGGGGDAPLAISQAPDTPSPTNLAIGGFVPTSAAVGGLITVTGTDLGAVQTVKLGGIEATFVIESATQLRVTVPQGAQTGRISLIAGGRVVISATDLTLNAVAQVISVSPTTVPIGGRFTVTGSSLDQVRRAQLGGVALVIVSQSVATLVVEVPSGATSDFLTLVGSDEVARTNVEQITVIAPINVTATAPAIALRGRELTLTGSSMDRVSSVRFTGSTTDAAITSRNGPTGLAVSVPLDAATGPLTLGASTGEVASSSSITVVSPILVDPAATWQIAAGAPLVVTGTGFDEVTAVTIGTLGASIAARTDTRLTVTLPPELACGPVTLLAASQPAVAAGNVVVGAGCTVRTAGVELAQVLSQSAVDGYERLVPGRAALVRAFVVSDVDGTAAPVVQLTALQGATTLGSLILSGPSILPTLANGSAVPNPLRYDTSFGYSGTLPANWVVAGLQVRIEVDPQQRQGARITTLVSPSVGSTSRLDLVLVPLVSGGNAPLMPQASEAIDELVRRMPFDRSRISVTVRAPYTLTSTTNGVDTQSEWSDVLAELERLRRNEAPNRHYFGMVKPMVSSGVAGIGYVNRVGNNAASLAALGWDASRSGWRRTMVHELGHNFSRPHAPCGSPSSPDASYPYSGGSLSATPLFDALAGTVVSPVGLFDVMGYCNGAWFSDYNFREVQRFVEAQPNAMTSIQQKRQSEESAARTAPDMDLLQIDGRLTAGTLDRVVVQARRGPAPVVASPPVEGPAWVLRLVRTDGSTVDAPFEPLALDHLDDEMHFHIALPHPGALVRLDVLRDGVRVGSTGDAASDPSRSRPLASPIAPEVLAQTVDWTETPGHLEVRWQASLAPSLGVTWISPDGQRQVLALHVVGGQALITLPALPAGGLFEFSLVDGLNARSVQVAR